MPNDAAKLMRMIEQKELIDGTIQWSSNAHHEITHWLWQTRVPLTPQPAVWSKKYKKKRKPTPHGR